MDKLIQVAVEVRLNDTKISQIERKCYNGDISSEKALDLVVEEIKRSNKALKAILNRPVKIKTYDEQFMDEQMLHGARPN